MSLYYSFTDWDVLTPASFVGIKNYTELFSDELFFKSIQVTGIYTAIVVPLNVFLSLLVAMLLNKDGKFVPLFRTIYYLPAVLSGVVVAMLWQWIFNSKYGLLNDFLGKIGIEGPRWLADPQYAMSAMVIMSVWGIGGGIILYLAGLQAVPQDLYEAARLDGAGFWKKMFHITLPSMSPIILFTFLTSMIGTLQTFTQAYIMTSGGANHSTLFYAYYLYQNGFAFGKYRYKNKIFFMVLVTMMMPGTVTFFPQFIMFARMGWYGTLLPLWVPSFFGSAYYIFFLRQYFMTVPTAMIDAAKVDGCGDLKILLRIVMPMAKPVYIVMILNTFVGIWGDFFNQLIYITKSENYTISIGLSALNASYGSANNSTLPMIMAGSFIVSVPVLIFYYLGQKAMIKTYVFRDVGK